MKVYKRLTILEIAEIRAMRKLDPRLTISSLANKTRRDRKTIRDALRPTKPVQPRTRASRSTARRRNLVYKYVEMRSSRMVTWKVWEGTAREQTRRKLFQFPVYATARDISRQLFKKDKITVSPWAVWADLSMGGYGFKKRLKVVSMDPDLWGARLLFAQETKRILPGLDLAFADECMISLAVDSTLVLHYRRRGDAPLPRLVGRASGKAEKVHLWVIIGPNGFRQIKFFDENVTKEVYISQCLTSVKKHLKRNLLTLVHDNAGAHTASNQWIDDEGIFRLGDFTPYSPDMNVVEQVFPHLKRRVAARFPTAKNFRSIIAEEFAAIPQSILDGILRGFEKKLDVCIRREGRHFDI